MGRLLVFATICAAVLVLRREPTANAERVFTIPGGGVVPGLAASLCLLLLAGCTRPRLLATATAIGVGALLHTVARVLSARLQQAQHPVAPLLSSRSTSPCVGGGNASKRTPPSLCTKTPSGTSETSSRGYRKAKEPRLRVRFDVGQPYASHQFVTL